MRGAEPLPLSQTQVRKELKRTEKEDCSLRGLIYPDTLRSTLVFIFGPDRRRYARVVNG